MYLLLNFPHIWIVSVFLHNDIWRVIYQFYLKGNIIWYFCKYFPSFCFLIFSIDTFSVQFSRSVMSDSLRPHGLQHARLPCPSPTPGVYSDSCPLSQWCHPTISPLILLLPSVFPSFRVFSNESVLHIRWPKYWSFSFNINPSNEHPGLISYRMDWLDLLAVQGRSRVFSNTTVQKHQFFRAQLSF